MNPRKHPRTLNEAFGPYCGSHITEDRKFDHQDIIVMVASILCALAVAVIVWSTL